MRRVSTALRRHARAVLPELKKVRGEIADFRPHANNLPVIDRAIAEIEASTARPELVSLEEFKSRPDGR